MGLETASFISSLVATNPPGTDKKAQGDDHIRLIKTAMQGSFPTSSKAWYNPTTIAKVADFAVLAANMNTTFLVSTAAGAVTGTLPTLAVGDAGWVCYFVKTNVEVTAFWIAPASGTLQSGDLSALAKTRRVVPGVKTEALWTGAAWVLSRAIQVPVGTILDFDGTALPVGYEWPSGQTLSGAAGSEYPDYFARTATLVTVDARGRAVFGKDNLGGSTAGRITNAGSGIVGTTLEASGGEEKHTLTAAESAVLFYTSTEGSHSHTYLDNGLGGVGAVSAGANFGTGDTLRTTNAATAPVTTTANAGGGAHNNMPPAIILNKILVVE